MYQVSADYFDTIGIPLISGRDLNSVDPKAPKQALVNQAFARKLFGAGNAIGQSISSEDTRYDIVGVVKDSKSQTIGEVDQPILYRSLEQNIGLAAPPVGFSLLCTSTEIRRRCPRRCETRFIQWTHLWLS